MSPLVLVPDPDNERRMRAVDRDSGRIVAVGHLTLLEPDWPPMGSLVSSVAFIGTTIDEE